MTKAKAFQGSSAPLLPMDADPCTALAFPQSQQEPLTPVQQPSTSQWTPHMCLLHAAHTLCQADLRTCLWGLPPQAATASWVSGSALRALGYAHSTAQATSLGGSHPFLNLGFPSCEWSDSCPRESRAEKDPWPAGMISRTSGTQGHCLLALCCFREPGGRHYPQPSV